MKRMAILVAALLTSLISTGVFAADYKIDPVHSMLIYRIKHLQSSYSYGRFNGPRGTFTFDPASPEQASFELTIDVSNLDTANPQRDGHLKSPDFFNAKQFPTITFKSTTIKKTGENTFELTGDLALHGITKSITFPITYVGTGPGMAHEIRSGFEGTAQIKRSDFGMDKLPQAVGDDVRLIISIEGIQK